jgi:hypothetical protein
MQDMDENEDGRLSQEEIDLFFSSMVTQGSKGLMDMDGDGDGAVSQSEFKGHAMGFKMHALLSLAARPLSNPHCETAVLGLRCPIHYLPFSLSLVSLP